MSVTEPLSGQEPAESRQKSLQPAPQNHSDLSSKELTIRIGSHLDISSISLINQTINAIQSMSPNRVVIDLTETQHLFDSGLALLLLLEQEAGDLKNHIYVINGNSTIVSKLSASCLATSLHIL